MSSMMWSVCSAMIVALFVTGCLTCPPRPKPNRKPEFSWCPSNIMATAGRGENFAWASWTLPTYYDPDGDPVTMRLAAGSGPYNKFNQGRTLICYIITDSHQAINTCEFHVIVTVIRCPARPIPTSPATMYCSHDTLYGSQCQHNCGRGYTLVGFGVTECQADAVWRPDIPRCEREPTECTPLNPPSFGYVERCDNGFMEGSKCTVQCTTGYQLQGANKFTCTLPGSWSPPTVFTTCTVVRCPEVLVDNGNLSCPRGRYYASICQLTCKPGFTPLVPFIVCSFDVEGKWSNPAVCNDTEAPKFTNCPNNMTIYEARLGQQTNVSWTPPTATDNSGRIPQTRSNKNPMDPFTFGPTEVTYTATDGSGNSGTCKFTVTLTPQTCDKPDLEPERTTKFLQIACPEKLVYGAVCNISGCVDNHSFSGAKNIVCERTGNPPITFWDWQPKTAKPNCSVYDCPKLAPPGNGSLQCYTSGSLHYCVASCRSPWDFPSSKSDYRYFCSTTDGAWNGQLLRHCLMSIVPREQVFKTSIYYFNVSCTDATTDLQQKFAMRMNDSVCGAVNKCLVTNVEVFCGANSGRRRKSVGKERSRRTASSYFIEVSFRVAFPYNEGSDTPENIYQNFLNVTDKTMDIIRTQADAGTFNINGLTTDGSLLDYATITADCPPGTTFVATDTTTRFSCTGCSSGYYLPTAKSGNQPPQCEACPVGTYTALDNATSCTPCPHGYSTSTIASQGESDCKEFCSAGTVSLDGFMPCRQCPPGTYQSLTRAISCDLCPVGTWTVGERSTNLSDCVFADVHLTNTSLGVRLVGDLPPPGTNINGWIFLEPNASAMIRVGGNSAALFHLCMETRQTNTCMQLQQNSGDRHSVRINASTWYRLDVKRDKDADFFIFQRTVVTYLYPSADELSITPITGKVIASGFGLYNDTIDLASCAGKILHKSFTWNATGQSVRVPSVCDPINECLLEPCGAHTCENKVKGYVCHCEGGWSGINCTIPPDPCKNHTCNNGASCFPNGSSYMCQCQQGYTGSLCELEIRDGGWGNWSSWTDCSFTCGGNGTRVRRRFCSNPSPKNGGRFCTGSSLETENCGVPLCIDHGGWGNWNAWTQCTVSCGGGNRTRQRKCDSPVPKNGGNLCSGGSEETETCGTQICPACGDLVTSTAEGTIIRCTERTNPYTKVCTISCEDGYELPDEPPQYICGDRTAYLWNRQRERGSVPRIPGCSRRNIPVHVNFTRSIIYEAGCSNQLMEIVTYNMQQRKNKVPCFNASFCNATFELSCAPNPFSRTRRSADRLQITLKLNVDFAAVGIMVPDGSGMQVNYTHMVAIAEDVTDDLGRNGSYAPLKLNAGGSPLQLNVSTITENGGAACAPGSFSRGGYCMDCAAGSREEGRECFPCVVGEYQDEPASTYCKSCPAGYTTASTGSASLDECFLDCGKGTMEMKEIGQCVPCPIGQYQDEPFSKYCKSCPAEHTTAVTGSTTLDACILSCPAGTTVNSNETGKCLPCPPGQYQDMPGSSDCKPCPPEQTTEMWGAVSINDCFSTRSNDVPTATRPDVSTTSATRPNDVLTSTSTTRPNDVLTSILTRPNDVLTSTSTTRPNDVLTSTSTTRPNDVTTSTTRHNGIATTSTSNDAFRCVFVSAITMTSAVILTTALARI